MIQWLTACVALIVTIGCGDPDWDSEYEETTGTESADESYSGSDGRMKFNDSKADGWDRTESEDGDGQLEPCIITMCLTGAMSHETPSNAHFRELCNDARIPGLQLDCAFGQCNGTFDSFLQFPLLTVYPALLDALDVNGDGLIDDADPVCEVNLLGFSWGGVNVLSIAHHLSQDRWVPESHRHIHRAVLIDAFQPFSQHRMTVPSNVDSVLSIRHSVAPNYDCSGRSPLGPYLGMKPLTSDGQNCDDYDYSQVEDELFEMYDGRLIYGGDVGHCEVPSVAHESVIAFLNDEPYEGPLPPRGKCGD